MKILIGTTIMTAQIATIGFLGVSAIQANDRASFLDENRDQISCMALGLYHEARGESELGQKAVAYVMMNRVESRKYPSSVCGVVKQGRKDTSGNMIRHKCQFSFYCDGKSDRTSDLDAWETAYLISSDVILNYAYSDDPTDGSVMYHTTAVSPYWKSAYAEVNTIGTHIFYKEK